MLGLCDGIVEQLRERVRSAAVRREPCGDAQPLARLFVAGWGRYGRGGYWRAGVLDEVLGGGCWGEVLGGGYAEGVRCSVHCG